MKRIAAGTKVGTGYYWNVGRWEFANVGPEGGLLRGESHETYVKVPFGVALLAAPVAGLLFVVFLPFIGVALAVGLLVKKVAARVHGGATTLAAVVQPPMATGAAYLTGEKPGDESVGKPGEKPAAHPELEKLAKEVGERRNEK
jgi:hypothetical protein